MCSKNGPCAGPAGSLQGAALPGRRASVFVGANGEACDGEKPGKGQPV